MNNVNKQSSMAKLKPGVFLLFLILFGNCLLAQNCKLIKSTDYITPLFVTIVQEDFYSQMSDSILRLSTQTGAYFLLLNGSRLSSANIRDSVNSLLNKDVRIIKSKIYLMIVGTKAFFDLQNHFDLRIFASKYFVRTDGENINSSSFSTVGFRGMNLKDVVRIMSKSYLWETELEEIKKIQPKENLDVPGPLEIGLGISELFPSGIRNKYDIPEHITTYNIQISRSINSKYKFWGNVSLGMNMPSKNNMGSMETSFSDGVYNIMGYTAFSWSVNLSRFLSTYKDLRPFVSAGITKTNLMVLYVKSGGSSMKPNFQMYNYGSLSLATGFEFNCSEKIVMDFKTSYNFSLNTGATVNNLNLSLGLYYKLIHKTKAYCEYLKVN